MKYVFYISDPGITAYQFNNKAQISRKLFDWRQTDAFDAYLAAMVDNASVDVVLDVVDEELNFEWLPKVHPWEKQGIAERRKHRLKNENTLLAQVKWIGITRVSEDGRNEELMLTSTIAESYHLSSFLHKLEEAQVVLKNIHSKVFLLDKYFNKKIRPFLKLNRHDLKKPFLLVTQQSRRMFRQTFFSDGEIRLSRLVEIDDGYDSIEDIRQALLAETKLAVTYVYNQKIIPFDHPIGFIFVDRNKTIVEDIEEACHKVGLIDEDWEEADYIVASAGFKEISKEGANCRIDRGYCFSEQAVVDFVLSGSPVGFYQNDYCKKINALLLGRNALLTINITLFLFGLFYILISGIDSWLSWERQQILEQKITQHEAEKERLQQKVQLQDDAKKIKASVEFSESILELKINRLINFDINALSEVFTKSKHIQLQSIKWKTLDRFDSQRNQIDIEALVFPFYDTFHNPVKWVDEFVMGLKSIQGVESVELQKEPLNRRLSQSLIIDANRTEVNALPFTVSLKVKDVNSK